MEGLRNIDGGDSVLPFVAQFYGTASTYIWENRAIRSCPPSSQSVSTEHWRPQESGCSTLLAYIVCRPERVVNIHTLLRAQLWHHRILLDRIPPVHSPLEGLRRVDETVVSFHVLQFSFSLREDSDGTTHTIVQGEEGEQGDPLMPLQSSNNCAKESISSRSHGTRSRAVGLLENALWAWAGMSIHQGKTKIWDRAGCEILERVARIEDPSAHVWRGPELLAKLQGLNILGTPLGNPEFVRAHLYRTVQ